MIKNKLAKIVGMGMLSLIPMSFSDVNEAKAEQIMMVEDNRYTEDISVMGELKTVSTYEYNVTNNNDSSNEPINYFDVSAGLNDNVLNADAPFGWDINIGDDLTSFTTDVDTQRIYSFSSFPKTFVLYADDVGEDAGVGYANARASSGADYNQVSVGVPVPEPSSGVLACLGLGCAGYGAYRMFGKRDRKEEN